MHPYPDRTKALLLNLAIRYRMARRQVSRARGKVPDEYMQFLQGQVLEANNSFQAAKQIVYRG